MQAVYRSEGLVDSFYENNGGMLREFATLKAGEWYYDFARLMAEELGDADLEKQIYAIEGNHLFECVKKERNYSCANMTFD